MKRNNRVRCTNLLFHLKYPSGCASSFQSSEVNSLGFWLPLSVYFTTRLLPFLFFLGIFFLLFCLVTRFSLVVSFLFLFVEVGESLMDRSLSEDGLYRVKSCPDIVDQLNEDDGLPKSIHLELELSSKGRHQVQLRVRSAQSRRDSQTQRYSCGALPLEPTTPPNSASPNSGCGSRHDSNHSLNCNSFSVIEVS